MPVNEIQVDPRHRTHYADALAALHRAGIDYLVGGGFGLGCYLVHWRQTKDLDVFLRPREVDAALDALRDAGFTVDMTDPAWLAKARRGGTLTDLIFRSYNGLYPVGDRWFENARGWRIFGTPVRIVGPEEMIVSKAFVAARDRFDGSDISWLLRALGDELDWSRVEAMFPREHRPVLLWQLVHFLYVFPNERRLVPRPLLARLMRETLDAACAPVDDDAPFVCRGPMLDPISYRTLLGRPGAGERPERAEATLDGAADAGGR